MAPSNVVFEAPSTAASTPPASWGHQRKTSATSFDPYHPDSYTPTMNYTHSSSSSSSYNQNSYQNIPLLPTRTPQEEERLLSSQQPRGPRVLQKSSKRTGRVPDSLSVTEYRTSAKIDDESPGLYNPYEHGRKFKASDASQDSLLNTPSFPNGLPGTPSKARRHPIPFASRGFEAPEWKKILLHVVLCAAAYPFLLLVVFIAQDRTIFWCRAIVGIGCGLVGVALGLSLVELAKSFLEAATWATLIHQSNVPYDAPGVRLRDLSSTVENGTTLWAALRLGWARYMYSGTARHARKAYDKRPWTLFIAFFLCTATLASILPFLLGRITDIQTKIVHDEHNYREVTVKGDLSPADIARAANLTQAFTSFTLTWTISPFSALGNLPPAISLRYQNEDVYFAEVSPGQLSPNGSGFGTFDQDTTAASIDTDGVSERAFSQAEPGTILRFPRWGIRNRCKRVSNGNVNIVPLSANNFTYVFVPRSDIRDLFREYNMDVPALVDGPFDRTAVLGTDKVPDTVDIDSTLDKGKYQDITHFSLWSNCSPSATGRFASNGVAHSFKSFPVTMDLLPSGEPGQEGFGWISIETLLIRINDAYTPHGKFQVKSDQTVNTTLKDANETERIVQSRIGYDAAVCLELFEPYIVQVYNSTLGLPSTMKVVSKGGHIADDIVDGVAVTVRHGDLITNTSITRELNSTMLPNVYITLHDNSVNQVLKDNGRDADYVPSPTTVSYTGGTGPSDYTELSPEFFAKAKAKADSANMLPYLAGSGDAVAWAFQDQVLASARLEKVLAGGLLAIILGMGLIAGFFVPKLPMDVPRRSFTLYSWLTAFQANELVGDRPPLARRQMHLDDLEKEYGDLKFRYGGF
ncbi:hypothetical protein PQX77_016983 [Marasmius sp. AFHP31]|nr:hypothetical protein PQX77_016983 [Marasmius sp. AFHP31]